MGKEVGAGAFLAHVSPQAGMITRGEDKPFPNSGLFLL